MLTSDCQDQGSKELHSVILLLSDNLCLFMSISCITFCGSILKILCHLSLPDMWVGLPTPLTMENEYFFKFVSDIVCWPFYSMLV